jgi:hypothetical protein
MRPGWCGWSSRSRAIPRRRSAIGPKGETAAEVRLPRALTVFEIGTDYILGAYADAAAEPYVAMYRLRRR